MGVGGKRALPRLLWPIRFIRERAKGAMSDRKKDRGEGSKRKRTKNLERKDQTLIGWAKIKPKIFVRGPLVWLGSAN